MARRAKRIRYGGFNPLTGRPTAAPKPKPRPKPKPKPKAKPRTVQTIGGVPAPEIKRVTAPKPKSKPKPKRARKPSKKRARRLKKTEDAGMAFNVGLDKAGFAGYPLRNLYSAPGTVERANFKGLEERLWPKVRAELGLPKGTPMPKSKVKDIRDDVDAFVDVGAKPGKRKVVYDTSTASGARLRPSDRKSLRKDPRLRKSAQAMRTTPIHEWAHVFQDTSPDERAEWMQRMLDEGGAEVFSRDVARRIGMGTGGNRYPKASKMARRKGRRYIRKGQFAGRS